MLLLFANLFHLKNHPLKILFFVLSLVAIIPNISVSAQGVGGEWYGVGKVKKAGDHNSYLSEMVLKQKGNRVTGELNYFYRSDEIKTKITGKYDAKYKVLELDPQPMLSFLAKDRNGADCPMEGSFTLKIIDGEPTLLGQFNPTYDYRVTCPAIDVKFTKSRPEIAKTAAKKPAADTVNIADNKLIPNKKVANVTPVTTNKSDSARKSLSNIKSPTAPKQITPEEAALLAFKHRAVEASQIIEVDADSLKVALYDNGDVDNDSISLFYNRQLVATKLMLSDKPLEFTFPIKDGVNEISMFAENLGKIPPNTALAIIYAGDQRFELNLTSTLDKNAAIRFKHKKKNPDVKNIN
jgi:hypothetical protein